MPTKGGDVHDVVLSMMPDLDSDGQVIGVACAVQDITQLKASEREAARCAEEYACLVELVPTAVIATDASGYIKEWNQWLEERTGMSKSSVLGKKLQRLAVPKSQKAMADMLEDACGFRNSRRSTEVVLETEDGDPLRVTLNGVGVVDSSQHVVGALFTGEGASGRRSGEAPDEGAFFGIAGMLRCPLHGILGMSNALRQNKTISPSVQWPLQVVHNSAGRLVDLLTKLESDPQATIEYAFENKLRLERNMVQVADIVQEVLRFCDQAVDKYGHPVKKSGVRLINAVSAQLPVIEADANRCAQLIFNLVDNALKFTHSGQIRVSATHDDDEETLTLEVRDTGPGIAPDKQETIFQPQAIEVGSWRRKQGLKLGLAICRDIAVAHGGSVSVHSQRGRGSAFRVVLPYEMAKDSASDFSDEDIEDSDPIKSNAEVEAGKRASPPASTSSLADLGPMTAGLVTVLIADEEGGTRDVVAPAFQSMGIKVLSIRSHSQLRGCFSDVSDEDMPVVAVLDVQEASDMGLRVLKEIRDVKNLVELPVIVLSAHSSTSWAVKCFSMGCNDFMSKPFDLRELASRVKVLVQMRHMTLESMNVRGVSQPRTMDSLASHFEDPKTSAQVADSHLKSIVSENIGQVSAGAFHHEGDPAFAGALNRNEDTDPDTSETLRQVLVDNAHLRMDNQLVAQRLYDEQTKGFMQAHAVRELQEKCLLLERALVQRHAEAEFFRDNRVFEYDLRNI
jgi:PAS domain S-box-containing protein